MIRHSDDLIVIDRSGSRRKIILVVAAIAAIALILVGAFALMKPSKSATPAASGGAAGGQVPTVTVIVPGQAGGANVVTASGALAARRDQPVGIAGTGGRVTRVLVDAGSWVRAGQPLATVDRSVQVQQADQLAAAIASARANAALAQNNYDRALALVGNGFISKADLDAKKAARDSAFAQVRVAQAQLGATRAQIGQLDVRAPTAGLVLSRSVELGQIVSAGSPALFRIAAGGEMEMRALLSQQDLARVHVGMPATVTPVGSTQSVAGRVWLVSPVIDPTSRQGEVRISIPYSANVRPGGFAEARISAGTINSPVLPQSAVLSDDKGTYVYVVGKDDKVSRRNVQIGQVTDAGVAIAGGLTGQETIVASAGPFLNEGQKVQPRRTAAR
ncbi:efflux RND transporter periplasmic adaptor subunit [Sphingomonas sp. ASV193]|uniref:efflux RND transporter periplasmic adaptor subunit n=1 Tax=Sphingomonas sp. ASV193 TaxID=3144405 RepID=UPI0032E87CEA